MLISVTFPQGQAGPLALVRMKEAGQPPEYRSMPMTCDIEQCLDDLLDFIWSHAVGSHCRQGWLWEA